MRCDDLTRELATPTGRSTSAEMARHLAACPSCAAWSRQADRLEHVWDATRPAEPSSEVLDALWAQASAALDAPSPLRLDPARTPARLRLGRRRWVLVAAGLAQAAVVVIGATALFGGAAPLSRPVAAPAEVRVDVDTLAVVRIGADRYNIERLDDTPQTQGFMLATATQHDFFNDLESAGAE